MGQVRTLAAKSALLGLFFSLLSMIPPTLAPKASAAIVGSGKCVTTVDSATGVVIIDSTTTTGNCIIRFTSTGPNTWTRPLGVDTVTVLVVGAGGGGGSNAGEGGGGGAVIYGTVRIGSLTTLSITVGAGGAGGINMDNDPRIDGQNGSASKLTSSNSTIIVQAGGGRGGQSHWSSNICGASSGDATATASGGTIDTTTGLTVITSAAGKQGGYFAGSGVVPSAGTQGTSISLPSAFRYGASGGGGAWGANGGASALDGGGKGGNSRVAGDNGSANSGGGGGGGGDGCSAGGAGGSGLITLSYAVPVTPSAPETVTQVASGTSATISWKLPRTGAASFYRIESSTTGTTWSLVDTVTANTLSYQVNGLLLSTTYYFRVAAYLNGLEGTFGYPWTKIYGTTAKNRNSAGAIDYESGFGIGANDSASTLSATNPNFSRVRYQINTTINGVAAYAETDFYKWSNTSADTATASTATPTISNLRIPTTFSGNQVVIQANVEDLNVYSTDTRAVTGKGYTGRLEIWPWDYSQTLSGLKPPGSSATFDYDDAQIGSGTYGSFQVHNLTESAPVFVWNRQWNGVVSEIAYGKNPVWHPDWTFCQQLSYGTCPAPSDFRLQIFVNTPLIVTDVTAPTRSSATLQSAGNQIQLSYDETLSVTTPAAARFSVSDSGTARSVTSVSFADSRTITLTLSAMIAKSRTVTISYDTATTGALSGAALIEDLALNDAAAFTNISVTNNSTILNRLDTPTTLAVSSTETNTATFTFTNTTNASSHTLRIYESSTATLRDTATSFTSGSTRTGLTPATQYYATLQAVGDGVTYESSTASSPLYFTTAIRKPVIASQPSDTATTTSRSATFAVTATSPDTGTLSYQWQRSSDGGSSYSTLSNGAGISGVATATLTLSSLTTTENSSRYRVVVTTTKVGVTSFETSTAATLTVNGAISLTGGSNISKEYFTAASSAVISASGGTGTISFTISGSTAGISINANNGVVTSDETTPRGTYSLTITATDQTGATATQSITITITQGIPTLSISLSSTPRKGTNLTFTATTSVAGTVRFLERGRVISGCKSKTATGGAMMSLGSRTATCTWKPRIHGPSTVSAILTPASADYSSTTARQDVLVLKRTASRS